MTKISYIPDYLLYGQNYIKFFNLFKLLYFRPVDLIVVISARKAKSRAQLTPMRTTVAYRGTKCIVRFVYTHSVTK